MATDVPLSVEQKRAACLEMAAWLEGRRFGVTLLPGEDPQIAALVAQGWAEGYRRAIHELRWAAMEPEQIPDDIGELDGE